MKLEIINHTSHRVPRRYLKRWVDTVERQLKARNIRGLKGGQKHLLLVFVSDQQIKGLNQQFRGKNKTTDILSFAPVDPNGLGELIVAPKVIAQQAREHGLSFRDELAYMVLHGILHLLGFEHEQGGAKAKQMFALQDEIFSLL